MHEEGYWQRGRNWDDGRMPGSVCVRASCNTRTFFRCGIEPLEWALFLPWSFSYSLLYKEAPGFSFFSSECLALTAEHPTLVSRI